MLPISEGAPEDADTTLGIALAVAEPEDDSERDAGLLQHLHAESQTQEGAVQ